VNIMQVLAFAASRRSGSLNRRLIGLAAELATAAGAEVDLAEYREFDMPMYDGDLNATSGLPAGAVVLKERLARASAVMIAVPEYNYSIPGTLKNAIDWVSRARPMPWRGKSMYLLSASPGAVGGIRGLWQTRIPFEGCGALVFPDMFALPHADKAFDDAGRLRDAAYAERLGRDVTGFVRLAQAVSLVCAGKATPADAARQQAIAAALESQSKIQPACLGAAG
jgi:chromate reductase, NAD(P)H dehydrogenase (quinone)